MLNYTHRVPVVFLKIMNIFALEGRLERKASTFVLGKEQRRQPLATVCRLKLDPNMYFLLLRSPQLESGD